MAGMISSRSQMLLNEALLANEFYQFRRLDL